MLESVPSYGLAAGVAALFNPCSLLFLPVWLAMVAARASCTPTSVGLRWSAAAALALTGGYTVSFSVALVATGGQASAAAALAYVSAGTGMLIVLLASFLVAGGRVPLLQAASPHGGISIRLGGLVVAGAVTGLASLAPQLPELLAEVEGELGTGVGAAGVEIAAYLLGLLAGFGLLCAAASWLGGAAGRRWPASGTVVDKAQGYLLLLAGLGTAYYAFFAARDAAGSKVEDRLIDAAHGVHGLLIDALEAFPVWLIPAAYAVLTGWLLLRKPRPRSEEESSTGTAAAAVAAASSAAVPVPESSVRPRRRPLPQQDGGGAVLREPKTGPLETEGHRPRHFNPKALRRARDVQARPGRGASHRFLRAVKPRR
jgi:cytochrome c biogenesis protein CcdA